MTVQQLIEVLREYPPDMIVVNGSNSQEIDIVEKTDEYYEYGDEESESVILIV